MKIKRDTGELWEENEEMIESYFKDSIPHIGRHGDEMCKLLNPHLSHQNK